MNEPDDIDRAIRDAYQGGPGGAGTGDPGATARLMERVRREPAPRRGRLAWWFAPDALRVSPAAAVAVLAVALLAGAYAGGRLVRSVAPEGSVPRGGIAALATATPPEPASVTFTLRAPDASRVSIVGDFNGWSPDVTPLARSSSGVWTAAVPLERGLHNYAFVIDGREWRTDPAAPLAAGSTFGSQNSVVIVGGGDAL